MVEFFTILYTCCRWNDFRGNWLDVLQDYVQNIDITLYKSKLKSLTIKLGTKQNRLLYQESYDTTYQPCLK